MLGLPGAGGDDMEDDVVINGGPATATTPTEISPAPATGLGSAEAAARLRADGPNTVAAPRKRGLA
ncbi:hypothetical protein, partial [Micromonospora aurantiaca (nom. illeg.)]